MELKRVWLPSMKRGEMALPPPERIIRLELAVRLSGRGISPLMARGP